MFSLTTNRRRRSNAALLTGGASPIARLEARALLAGNVTVSVTLDPYITTIIGDGADNSVRIVVENGQVVVRGIETTINGSTAAFPLTYGGQVLANPPTPILFNLNGGNDSIEILDIGSMWDYFIAGTAGNDTTVIRDSDTLGGLIYGEGGTDAGHDRLTIINSIFSNGMQIDTGAGNDIVTFQNVESGDLTKLNLGLGDDTLTMNELTAFAYHPPLATVLIEAGDGNDRLNLSNAEYHPSYGDLIYTVDLGGGNDSLEMSRMAGPVINVLAGAGNDTTVFRNGSGVFWNQVFRYGVGGGDEGNDSLLIANVTIDWVTIDMGAGTDTLTIQDSMIQQGLQIAGSSGVDVTRLQNVTAWNGFQYGINGLDLGNDVLSILLSRLGHSILNLGAGNDRLVIDKSQIHSSQIQLGDGNDVVSATAWAGGAIDLDAGRGADLLSAEIDASRINLVGGDGNDLFELKNLRIGQESSIQAGAGNDVIAILFGQTTNLLRVDGDTGRDTLHVSLQFQLIGSISVSYFESYLPNWVLANWLNGRSL